MPKNIKMNTELKQNMMQSSKNNQQTTEPDWAKTINNLMNLAKEANNAFEYDQAVNYLNTLEEIWDAKDLPEFSLELRFELYREKGKALASQGKHEEAITEYQKILKFCRDISYLNVKSETFTQIGQLLAKKGDHDRALGYLQRAIGAYRRLNDKNGICKALRNLGVIYLELGEFEEAEINYHEAIEIARENGEQTLYADLINNLGAIMNMKGNWKKALDLYRESLQIYKSQNEVRKKAYTINNLAITLSEQGLRDEAFEYFKNAYEIATDIKDASLALIVDINLADLYLKKRNLDEAKLHCQRAEQYLIDNDLINGNLVETKKIAGKIAYTEKDYNESLKFFNEAIEISRQIGTQYIEAEVLLERGILYQAMKRNFDALADLESSYHIYSTLKAENKQEQTKEIINSIEKLYLELFYAMGKEVDHKDKYTKDHSDRVASLALLLGKELGLHTNMLKTIVAAGLLHDIGKIKIEDSILKKNDKLTTDEYQRIKKHPEVGVALLRRMEFPWDIKPLILHHHEKYNGTGYPLGLKGDDIPLGAQIICIADVFDALTSDRVYRPAYDAQKALTVMNNDSGTSFDPVLLRCFTDMINSGKANQVINANTKQDKMFDIWALCMSEELGPDKTTQKEPSLK